MDTKHLTVAMVCGGRSAEHEVSLISARDVLLAADKRKYSFILIGIDRRGTWRLYDIPAFLNRQRSVGVARLGAERGREIAWRLGKHGGASIVPVSSPTQRIHVDVVFPLLHGPYGEDGAVQGLLRLADLPFVGSDVLASAVCMDKGVSKRLLREAGIPVVRFREIHEGEGVAFGELAKALGVPLFVKPANLGSSVGVSKVSSAAEFARAVQSAFRFDTKLLVEAAVTGQEVECSVVGNDMPVASRVGEIVPHDAFYTYRAKYLDEDGAELRIPAGVSRAQAEEVCALAIRAYQVLECEGMARVDFFIPKTGEVLVNEVNTIPGFTPISMYPKLWEADGLSYARLIDRLIALALERHRRDAALQTRMEGWRASSGQEGTPGLGD